MTLSLLLLAQKYQSGKILMLGSSVVLGILLLSFYVDAFKEYNELF
jgi:hypothetical protein